MNAQSRALGHISDNVANSQTVGFKRTDTNFVSYISESNSEVHRPGTVLARPDFTNQVQGTIEQVENPLAMAISGALAGMMAVNEILGVQHRLLLAFTAGYGFVGIAVALMGRGHPAGIVFAALLFGVLYQGGTELAFDKPNISRDMIVVIQGLVILFAGALEFMLKPWVAQLLARREQA
jgi:ABC-type uncharacterized transport system permease subunit